MAVAKSALQECVQWIVANLPDKFRRDRAMTAGKRQAEHMSAPETATASEPASKAPRQHMFDITTYSLEKFRDDASALMRSLPEQTLLTTKQAVKFQPFDSASSTHAAAVQFDTALERLGVTGAMKAEI